MHKIHCKMWFYGLMWWSKRKIEAMWKGMIISMGHGDCSELKGRLEVVRERVKYRGIDELWVLVRSK